MTPKIKTRQTSKQPISTKQIVALFVHTNQQHIEFLEKNQMERLNMDKNTESN